MENSLSIHFISYNSYLISYNSIVMAPKKKTTSTELKTLEELKTLSAGELQTELQSARKNLYVLTMKKALGELKQSHLMKAQRKYIAQISTFLTSAV